MGLAWATLLSKWLTRASPNPLTICFFTNKMGLMKPERLGYLLW
jgi:hypothetical protein